MSCSDTLTELMRVGLTEEPRAPAYLTDEPKLPVYQARIGSQAARLVCGQGVDANPESARVKAVAEALERYCLLDSNLEPGPKARFGDLDNQIDPADFFCYSSAQVPDHDSEVRAIRTAEIAWTAARDHVSGRELFVPRQMVTLDAAGREAIRIRRESSSSGAALGKVGTGEAFARGLFELIERDALMRVWLTNDAPARITAFEGALAELIALLARYRLDCRVFDTRGDLDAPSVLALTVDRSGVGPAVTAGIGAAETYEQAVRSAVLESVGHRRSFRLLSLSSEIKTVEQAHEIVSVESRIAYWSDVDRLTELPAWWSATAGVSMSSLASYTCGASTLLSNCSNRGFRVLESNITVPEVSAQGFEVVRVIVPELHPLYIAEAAKALRSDHLGELAALPNLPPHPFG